MLNAAPLGLRLTKEALNHAIDAGSLEAVIAMEDRNQILCSHGEDFQEGVRAFLEKIPPKVRRRRIPCAIDAEGARRLSGRLRLAVTRAAC